MSLIPRIKRIKVHLPLLLLWISLTSTAPFIFYTWPGHPYKVLTFICLSLMALHIFANLKRQVFSTDILLLIFIQIAFFALITVYHKDLSNLNHCIQLISLLIIIMYIKGFIGFGLFVRSYIYIVLAMGIGGTIIFFLHALIGVKPLFSVNYSESGTSYFLGLTTTNVYFNIGNLRLIRYSGFFDEPGAFALYSIFAVILNRIYFNNRIIELWLIAVTMFALSLAFYIMIVVFFLLFYINRSNLKRVVFIIATISLSYLYISNHTSNPIIGKFYDLSFKRLEINEKGIAGNNRFFRSDNDKKIFYKYPILGAGSQNKLILGSNFFSIFAKYGLLGSLFYYAFLVYLLLLILTMRGNRQNFYLKILILILLNFFHRPELSSVFALLVMVSIIYFIKDESISRDYIPEPLGQGIETV